MEVTIRQEAGYDLALYGFSLSYKDRAIPTDEWWFFNEGNKNPDNIQVVSYEDMPKLNNRRTRTKATATANAGRGKGHDKFLRQVQVWIDIEAPRYWWSEFDTYKVGTVAQSESTMHTLSRRDVTTFDFEEDASNHRYLDVFNSLREIYPINTLKGMLPEGYLQRRLVTMNYAVLRTIIEQRANHKLPEWATFIKAVYEQAEHKELLPKEVD